MKKIIFQLFVVATVLVSCTKEEETVTQDPQTTTNPDNNNNPNPTNCLPDAFVGTFLGSGSSLNTTFLDEKLTITKTACNKVEIKSVAGNKVFTRTITVSDIVANANGGYVGKKSDGAFITISLNTNILKIVGKGDLEFQGLKQ